MTPGRALRARPGAFLLRMCGGVRRVGGRGLVGLRRVTIEHSRACDDPRVALKTPFGLSLTPGLLKWVRPGRANWLFAPLGRSILEGRRSGEGCRGRATWRGLSQSRTHGTDLARRRMDYTRRRPHSERRRRRLGSSFGLVKAPPTSLLSCYAGCGLKKLLMSE
jgi:hypothetical protein